MSKEFRSTIVRKWLPLEEWKRQHHIPAEPPQPIKTRVKRDRADYGSVLTLPEKHPAMERTTNPAESHGTVGGARTSKSYHCRHEADDGKSVA